VTKLKYYSFNKSNKKKKYEEEIKEKRTISWRPFLFQDLLRNNKYHKCNNYEINYLSQKCAPTQNNRSNSYCCSLPCASGTNGVIIGITMLSTNDFTSAVPAIP
jgi:hypothetical protein